jgi:hypothetical protein
MLIDGCSLRAGVFSARFLFVLYEQQALSAEVFDCLEYSALSAPLEPASQPLVLVPVFLVVRLYSPTSEETVQENANGCRNMVFAT